MTNSFQTASQGQARRAHSIMEARNFMCANIKRNDPAARRFLQYLTMESSRLVVLIRDAKTSKILSSPPSEELWLNREKAGLRRASKNDWTIRAEVGQKFFEKSKIFFQTCTSVNSLMSNSGKHEGMALRVQRILRRLYLGS